MENKNKDSISCKIIEDLLPSYADEICSVESKELVESHIETCENCRKKLERMKSDEIGALPAPEDERILALVGELQGRERKRKRTTFTLTSICTVLAISLVVSIALPRITSGELKGKGELVASTETKGYVGEASDKSLGDYNAASDYQEIYNYVNKIYKEENRFTEGLVDLYGGPYEVIEDAKEESAATDSMKENGMMSTPSADAGAESNDSGDFSSTNIMTLGLDESDISKTDGSYIYNVTGSEILIFDITQGEAREIGGIKPEFKAPSDIIREIYLDGDLLSIITEHADLETRNTKEETNVLVYNISDRKNAELIGSFSQGGTFHTARKKGDIIYLFTDKYLGAPDFPIPSNLKADSIEGWFPTVNESLVSPDCVYLPQRGLNATVISSFSQKDQNIIDTKVIINDYADIYVGDESIYLYSSDYVSGRDMMKISKISYKDGKIKTGASTSLRGYLNDNFAINEYGGYLRVVTTEWNNEVSNMLYVLDSDLKECGRISNIAEGEQLYACRFMGDIGYFVTYETTDPLFTVDLKDPNDPRILGELKLLGFSEYLHFWGEDKLLGIGYESDEKGVRKGMKLSMFDISDPSNVTEESHLTLEDSDYSPGFYNYKAILAAPEKNVIGFARESYENEEASYEVYSYEDSGFTSVLKADTDRFSLENVRGHYSGKNFYISKGSKVESHVDVLK